MTESALPISARRPWWTWLNVLGLDAVITALLWLPLFAYASGARLLRAEYIVLGCAVWSIYALDRILDGLTASGMDGERHRFAGRHALLLICGVLAAAGLSAYYLAYIVREIVLDAGLKLMIAVGFYFGITWLSRRNWPGLIGAGTLCGLLAVALMQGTAMQTGPLWPHVWRAILTGFLITVLYTALKQPGAPAPWTLPRKLLGGWLFATGTALAPFAHLEMWRDLLMGSPVILFGVVCGLNSLGIRLWESTKPDFEESLLQKLFPWLLLAAAGGATTEWIVADEWSRPVLAACGLAALLLLAVHATSRFTTVSLRRALADGAMIVAAAAALLLRR